MAIQTNAQLVKLAISVVSVAAIAGISGSLANQAGQAPAAARPDAPEAGLMGEELRAYGQGDRRSRRGDWEYGGGWYAGEGGDDHDHDHDDDDDDEGWAALFFGERTFDTGRRTRTRHS